MTTAGRGVPWDHATGAAPVVAALCRETGALTIACVATPFLFEGRPRLDRAEAGLRDLAGCVDTLIHLPAQDILSTAPRATCGSDLYRHLDSVMARCVTAVYAPLVWQGIINVDLPDLRASFLLGSVGGMAIGSGRGRNRGPGCYQTEVVCQGKSVARCCLALLDSELPPTDRVLAELFLLRGDERHYLRTVNIQEEDDGPHEVTISQRVARRLGASVDDALRQFVRSL